MTLRQRLAIIPNIRNPNMGAAVMYLGYKNGDDWTVTTDADSIKEIHRLAALGDIEFQNLLDELIQKNEQP